MKQPLLPILAGLVVTALQAGATVTLPAFFSDHMVLQTGKPVPVWGKADPQEKVIVMIGSQTKSTVADQDGKWSVTLDPLSPGDPLPLTAQGSSNTRTVNDVLVGEVWLGSGQSNMALPVSKALNFETEQPAATWPKIRMLQPGNKWVVCSPETVGSFSAAAYFFGREIHKKRACRSA